MRVAPARCRRSRGGPPCGHGGVVHLRAGAPPVLHQRGDALLATLAVPDRCADGRLEAHPGLREAAGHPLRAAALRHQAEAQRVSRRRAARGPRHRDVLTAEAQLARVPGVPDPRDHAEGLGGPVLGVVGLGWLAARVERAGHTRVERELQPAAGEQVQARRRPAQDGGVARGRDDGEQVHRGSRTGLLTCPLAGAVDRRPRIAALRECRREIGQRGPRLTVLTVARGQEVHADPRSGPGELRGQGRIVVG